ncbi:hypothetical protein GE09DRAFT_632114 [Coniochaeta sp. 2T2.1]|nr:hypothetical protein GE09DRAFT_632114 [Coniochaeta sp. 2T2.1]
MHPPVLNPPVELYQSPPPTLLDLPVEIILEIADHLSSWLVAAALTVTCKALFHILEKKADKLGGGQQPASRAVLLGLLEKKHGHKFYHCQTCNHLHGFSQAWNPTTTTTKGGGPEKNKESAVVLRYCRAQHVFNPNPGRNGYNLSCAHARLVMNRHLRGAPKGLPLEALSRSVWTRHYHRDDGLLWRQHFCARIVGDDLLLRVRHVIEGSEENLRHDVVDGRHKICNHVLTGLPTSGSSCLEKKSGSSCEPLMHPELESAPRYESGRCDVCPTEYEAFVWRASDVRETRLDSEAEDGISHGPTIEGQRIIVFAYHNLGGCRDDQDWIFGLLATGREKSIFSKTRQMTLVSQSTTLSLRSALEPSTLGAKRKWLEGGRDLEVEGLLSRLHMVDADSVTRRPGQ